MCPAPYHAHQRLGESCKRGLNTKNGFDPKLWGNDMWHFLRWIAWAHPVLDRSGPTVRREACLAHHYKTFFDSLVHVLPCGTCCTHYASIIAGKHAPRPTDGDRCVLTRSVACSRPSLTTWLYSIQNCVSKRIGANVYDIPSYNSVRLQYRSGGAASGISSPAIFRCLLFVAWNYPKEASAKRIRGYRTFFNSLSYVLPTHSLRKWYAGILASSPPFLESSRCKGAGGTKARARLTRWVVSLWNNGRSNPKTYAHVCKWMGAIRK